MTLACTHQAFLADTPVESVLGRPSSVHAVLAALRVDGGLFRHLLRAAVDALSALALALVQVHALTPIYLSNDQ